MPHPEGLSGYHGGVSPHGQDLTTAWSWRRVMRYEYSSTTAAAVSMMGAQERWAWFRPAIFGSGGVRESLEPTFAPNW